MQEAIMDGVGVVASRVGQRAVGELAGGAGEPMAGAVVPDVELRAGAVATRRKFTAKYKLEFLERADACAGPGEVGELLRREGLYSSHLSKWRSARERGALEAPGRSRGRKPVDRRDQQIQALTRKLERSEAEAGKLRRVVEIQGNVYALLQETLGADSAQRAER